VRRIPRRSARAAGGPRGASDRVLVAALQVRFVPEPHAFEVGRPDGLGFERRPNSSTKAAQCSAAPAPAPDRPAVPSTGSSAHGHGLHGVPAARRADAGQELHHAEGRDPVLRILGEAQHGEHVLHMGGCRGISGRRTSRRGCCAGSVPPPADRNGGRRGTAPPVTSARSLPRGRRAPWWRRTAGLVGLVAHVTISGFSPERRSVHRFLVKRSDASADHLVGGIEDGCPVER
jgi:hypothetical protein